MAKVSIYLNFLGKTEDAFNFYKTIFKSEFVGPVMRLGDAPPGPGMPALSDAEKKYVMHVELPILPGYSLMGTDVPGFMQKRFVAGTNVHISVEPESRAETDRLFAALSEGGRVSMPLADQFWGAYYGALTDKFGIPWMFNFPTK